MTALSPDPFPTGGLRELSPREVMQRTAALACTLPKDNAPACTGQVNVGIFFDGTGNNRLADYIGIAAEEQVKAMKAGRSPNAPDSFPDGERKHSNVVRLFHAHKVDRDEGFFRFYIPGVGTPFAEIGDDGGGGGSAFGAGGEARILWAFTRLMNAPFSYVQKDDFMKGAALKDFIDKQSFDHSGTWQREGELRRWQDKLQGALRGKKPHITQINLSVFGFSRGAAEARAFTNWLFDACTQEDGAWLFAGIPLRVFFLGIFDTVAAVGPGNTTGNDMAKGHWSWGGYMEIHPAIEQCVHFIAGHEVRGSFSLDSVRIRGSYPPNAKEVMYPGSHSDVGGGYKPGALGVSPTQGDIMATVAAANMYLEARLAGVPLLALDELPEDDRNDLTPSQKVIDDMNAYLRAANVGDGRAEDMHQRHMSLYHSYRFKYRLSYKQRLWYVRASKEDRPGLDMTSRSMMERMGSLYGHTFPRNPNYDPKFALMNHEAAIKSAGMEASYQQNIPYQQLRKVMAAIDVNKLSEPIERFFDEYVHDSVAGFYNAGMNEYGLNEMAIMRFRSIFDKN